MEYIQLTTHRIKSQCLEISYWVNIFKLISQLFEIRMNLHFIFAGFESPFSKDPNFMDRFSLTCMNNQPKQMVIFKSLPILSFHIHTCILRKYSHIEIHVFWESIIFLWILFHFLIQASVSSILHIFNFLNYSSSHFSFTGFILVDHIRSRDMKIGEDRREMVEALLWSFFFTNSLQVFSVS